MTDDTWMESYDINELFTTDESWRGDRRGPSDDFWCLDLGDDAWDDDLYVDDDDPDAWKEGV